MIRPDERGPLRLGKKLSADMRSQVDYEPSDKERADHVSGKMHFSNKKPKFAKVATCIKNPTTNGLRLCKFSHTVVTTKAILSRCRLTFSWTQEPAMAVTSVAN